MTDIFSKKERSRIMSRIRSKNTSPELILKQSLKGMRLRFHPKILGNPDFGSKKKKIAIFIDGCFWHKCPNHYSMPKSNKKYWFLKIEANAKRDRAISRRLRKEGWIVLRIWEHEIKNNPDKCLIKITKLITRT